MILLAQIDFVSLLPFAVFGMIAAGAWWLLEKVAADPSREHQRLEEFRDPTIRKNRDEQGGPKESGSMTKVLEKASPTLAKPLQPKTASEAGKLKQRLAQGGFRGESATTSFLGLKFCGLMVGLVLGAGSLVALTGLTQTGIFRVVLMAGGLFYLPDAILWIITKSRKDAIFLGLPDALDLMVVCVEAGLALDQAMRKVADEMRKSYRTVADEFALCNLQLQMGRTRTEVLQELGTRTGVDDLRSLASILIQADKFGSSIAQALRVQSEAMRTRRRQIAEEKAAKTAVKLIFPLVIFIFPGIFVVLVGPAAITMVREMFPAMSGG